MKKNDIQKYLSNTWALALVFIVCFYLLTLLVYYFYSPGPEERKQSQAYILNSQNYGTQE